MTVATGGSAVAEVDAITWAGSDGGVSALFAGEGCAGAGVDWALLDGSCVAKWAERVSGADESNKLQGLMAIRVTRLSKLKAQKKGG